MSTDVVDAVVLAGGRGSRLGGVDKGALEVAGRTLLDGVLDAVAGCARVVVVGDVAARPGVLVTREDPPFAGPAAAVAAGLALVDAPWVLLLACDLPQAVAAVPALLGAERGPDGVVAVDETGRRQHLLCLASVPALRSAVQDAGDLEGAPLRRLLAPLDLAEHPLPARLTQDVDTWHDLERARGDHR